jgi:hypothetical protein
LLFYLIPFLLFARFLVDLQNKLQRRINVHLLGVHRIWSPGSISVFGSFVQVPFSGEIICLVPLNRDLLDP